VQSPGHLFIFFPMNLAHNTATKKRLPGVSGV
jgi:hypothetical protein